MLESTAADPTVTHYDDLVIGAGMAGLTTASLLAAQGRRVLIVEAHDTPGGYAHTFALGDYRFCAQVHYIFSCGEGESVHELLRQLGLEREVRFHRLDPEGFDHVVVAGERYRIPNGLEKFRDRLIRRHPDASLPLRRYFDTVAALGREMDRLPSPLTWRDLVTAPLRLPHLLRYQRFTLQRLYDHVHMPQRLQAVLAGQSGDYLLPPEQVSLLLHVALVRGYDRGAYYPERHFQHLVGSIADSIRNRPGCQLLLRTPITRIEAARGKVTGVLTRDGRRFTAERYISNIDPKRTVDLIDLTQVPREFLTRMNYEYSSGNFTLYLGVQGLDLREHGFGNWNVWHYPSDDLNAIYRRQLAGAGDATDPWLFLSTPTLHTDEPGVCPPGHQILEVATSAPYHPWRHLRATDRRRYNLEKKKVKDGLLALLEERYIPGLRKHLAMQVMGTPATNERFCGAPEGNAYGAALTPRYMGPGRMSAQTPFPNLWLANATAGYPSVAGTVKTGLDLVRLLSRAR
ncbi:MAG: NAD(P)/FAD-dependent oxidoreductase [Myxococcales bacterium]|nr:NAD(P)/FAD-dependent oxidoreductase [Myxococcales bacterium]